MSSATTVKNAEPWRNRLYLPAYRVSDAAKYSGVPTQTVNYWCRLHPQICSELGRRRRGQGLSYLELVEVAFVATFRSLGISLQRIRRARAYASKMLESEYPFAERQWFSEGCHVMLGLRDLDSDAAIDDLLVADEHGQLTWQAMVGERFTQFDYDNGLALTWHVQGKGGQVIIDPRISFGAPTVSGIPTWVLKGRWEAGESISNIKGDYGLSEEEIEDGLQFEGVRIAA